MFASNAAHNGGSALTRRLLISCLVVLLCFLLSGTAWADSNGQEADPCAQCHQVEVEAWQNSPHARAMTDIHEELASACGAEGTDCTCLSCHSTDFDPDQGTYAQGGVTCEACHGPYVEGHPESGVMQLEVDSSNCHECHTRTVEQWAESSHAQANVQCISCHLPHSGEFRLTDEALCGSCHRERLEDFAHTVHSDAGVTCTDCHLSSPTETAGEVIWVGGGTTPSHRFEVVSHTCAGCHGDNIHEMMAGAAIDEPIDESFSEMSERTRELATKLEAVERDNQDLKSMSVINLGIGLGVGGVLGIAFVFIVCRITQGGLQSEQ